MKYAGYLELFPQDSSYIQICISIKHIYALYMFQYLVIVFNNGIRVPFQISIFLNLIYNILCYYYTVLSWIVQLDNIGTQVSRSIVVELINSQETLKYRSALWRQCVSCVAIDIYLDLIKYEILYKLSLNNFCERQLRFKKKL